MGWFSRIRQFGAYGVVVALFLLPLPTAWALVQVFPEGKIDWQAGVIRAEGTSGKVEIDAPGVAIFALKEQQAVEAARKNLWAVLQRVLVDGEHSVAEAISERPALAPELRGLLQSAAIAQEEHLADGRVKVVLELGLRKDVTEALIPPGSRGKAFIRPKALGPPAGPPGTNPVLHLGCTGLVVDARGLKVSPALLPRLLNRQGEPVYDIDRVSRSYAVQQGMAVYLSELEAAKRSPRVGSNYIVVKAVGTAGKYGVDLVLSNEDVEEIRRLSKYEDFLQRCRVVIVVDRKS